MEDVSLKQKLGESITQFFILKGIEQRNKKTDNSPFLVLELGYPQGRVWSNIWDNVATFLEEYKEGDIVKVRGIVEKYRDQTQINIRKIRKAVASDDIYAEDLLPQYSGDSKVLIERLQSIITNIGDTFFRKLAENLLLKGDFSKKFYKAPAGKLWHHGYIGGLLEHTVSVTELVLKIGNHYPNVNNDILAVGGLFHDIGKVDSYSTTPYIEVTDEGRLIGHIVRGYAIVRDEIKKIKNFPEEHERQILHLILSHQGRHEYETPVLPMTREAFILYFADEIDSNLNAFDRISKEQKAPGKSWSDYVNLMDRFIYLNQIS